MGNLIKKGYTIQFVSPPPPFSRVLESVMSSQSAAVTTELKELMEKEAISRVPAGEENECFLRYFLVPKKTGSVRPILDLALFNK